MQSLFMFLGPFRIDFIPTAFSSNFPQHNVFILDPEAKFSVFDGQQASLRYLDVEVTALAQRKGRRSFRHIVTLFGFRQPYCMLDLRRPQILACTD